MKETYTTHNNHPVLVNMARAYQNDHFIAQQVFPEIIVDTDMLDVPVFDMSVFKLPAVQRSLYSDANLLESNVTYQTIKLEKADLSVLIDRKELQTTTYASDKFKALMQLKTQKVKGAKEGVLLSLEDRAARAVQDLKTYDPENTLIITSDASRFDSDSSDPHGVIQDCKKIVHKKIAREPNTLTLSWNVYTTLKNHLQLRSFSSCNRNTVNIETLKELFEIDHIFVGKALKLNDGGKLESVWNSNVVLAYQPDFQSVCKPAFSQTYRHRDYPYATEYWIDNEKEVLAIKYGDLLKMKIIGPEAGFLIAGTLNEKSQTHDK